MPCELGGDMFFRLSLSLRWMTTRHIPYFSDVQEVIPRGSARDAERLQKVLGGVLLDEERLQEPVQHQIRNAEISGLFKAAIRVNRHSRVANDIQRTANH